MKSYSAIEVRKRFGQILDEASSGERIVVERAGHPVAALIPMSDLASIDPERITADRIDAVRRLQRRARRWERAHAPQEADPVSVVQQQREARTEQIISRARHASEGSDPAR